MNKKGFTLIELLAVIIILAMLVGIISISADKTVKSAKSSLSQTQIEAIERAANIYYLKEGINNSYNNRSFKMCVNLSYLIENDYIEDEEVKDLKDHKKLEGSVEITYKTDQYTYKYKENSCTYEYQAIDEICRAVTEETKTTGNIPKGNYLPGDEYICEVKDNTEYHFFVVSTDGDNVNLIMERNVYYDEENDVGDVATEQNPGLVEWISEKDYGSGLSSEEEILNDKGPVTAMTYLHNTTKDWDNIPNIIINYEDENKDLSTSEKGTTGYKGIKTIGNITTIISKNEIMISSYENLKARMPYRSEVSDYDEINKTNKNLYNYLDVICYDLEAEVVSCNVADRIVGVHDVDMTHIKGISAYWTLSSNDEFGAINVNSIENIIRYDVLVELGVRPVISIQKLDIVN